MEGGDQPDEQQGSYARVYDAAFAQARAALDAGDMAPLADWFARAGAPPPRVIWRPTAEDLPEGALRGALANWTALAAGGIPDWRRLHAEEMGVDMVHLSVVDPVEDGDFRFALYGSAIASTAKRDYRGETVREMALRVRTPGPLFYHVVYSLALARGIPAATWSAAPPWQPVAAWHRLVLPFAFGEGGSRTRFLVAMKPDGTREVSSEAKREAEVRLS